MRVLITDDEADIRLTMSALLEHFGYSVRTAQNGAEALRCAEQWVPDVVLMDLSMPVMDGFLAMRKLRKTLGHDAMLIVAYSAHLQDPMTRQLARAAGCDECLTKPVDADFLQELLSRHKRRLAASDVR